MNKFPTEFPAAEISTLVRKLTGGTPAPDLRDCLEAAWTVAGYGLSQVQHDGAAAPALAPGPQHNLAGMLSQALVLHQHAQQQARPAKDAEDAVDLAEKDTARPGAQASPAAAPKLPWRVIIPMLTDLLLRWLERPDAA